VKAAAVLVAAFVFASVAALGQGQFLFNTYDPAAGNDVRFYDCAPISGPGLFVEVLAGPDFGHLQGLTPLLPLNGIGAGAGYTNPFSQTYTVLGMSSGASAFVAYRAFKGMSADTAVLKSPVYIAATPVLLTEAPASLNEVALGVQTAIFWVTCPEPSASALCLIGLGAVFVIYRRTKRGRMRKDPQSDSFTD
jgi:hypothetical protein